MSRVDWLISFTAVVALLLSGCQSTSSDGGFGDVQHVVADRTGLTVRWNQQTTDDAALAAVLQQMLSHDLTASGAAQIALLNNRHLQSTFEDLGIAQADLVQAGLLKNPVFNVGVRFPDRSPGGTYLDIGAVEDFLDIALIPARKKLAASRFEEAKAHVAAEVMLLAAQSGADFYAYQAAEEIVALQRTVAAAASASFDAAKRLHDAGNINDLEFASARAQSIRADIALADAQARADEAREAVNRRLGLWGTQTKWTASPHLPDIPPDDAPAGDLESLALERRFDLAAARQEILVQAQAQDLTADQRFFQEVNLGPEFERETDGQWRIGPSVSLSLPLFDQGQARLSRAGAVLRQSEENYLAMRVDVRSEVRAARLRLASARARAMRYHDELIPLEADLLHQTQLQYNGMYVGVFQLLQAKRDQIDAATQYVEALRDYWTARVELERAIGGKLPQWIAATRPAT